MVDYACGGFKTYSGFRVWMWNLVSLALLGSGVAALRARNAYTAWVGAAGCARGVTTSEPVWGPRGIRGFLLPGELVRLPFLGRWVCITMLAGTLFGSMEKWPAVAGETASIASLAGMVVLAGVFIWYACQGLYIPRMRNMGLSPWLLLLLIVPGINVLLTLALFIGAPKDAAAPASGEESTVPGSVSPQS